ncbi:FAD-binding and (Fe-S)-binding domain-containing protein [Mailhella massiliensis]|uniref:D-lactate dehydrogenase (cytochrome) n=1 Tax=Mailhella massiliensis TaxID=1903261 RepID=A0A921AW03_9BACT|nr:FAD-binding and (Fe-S)-binding domain-containing protein [Mailhella massiliensis]HJD96778.1 FAD-binding oxidoreductase [Mailhella massiliensis]
MKSQVFLNKVRDLLPWSQTHTGEAPARILSVDAGPFEPRAFAVIDVFSLDELKKLLSLAASCGVSLTFRGSGTSLSGQSVAEDVALRFRGPAWRGLDILDEGRLVRARAGMRGGEINAALAPYGRFIASDPSSIASATIGGMAANNAAGLGCTVENNIYHSLRGMAFMLADGTFVDTEDAGSVRAFRASHAALLEGLRALRGRILSSPALAEKVRRKYRIRNTCGYSLNALCDFEDPLDMLEHLLIGSEGTLGFIFSVTLETLPLLKERATAMALFSSMDDAMDAVLAMRSGLGLYAGEFLDDISLRCLSKLPGFPQEFCPEGESSDNCALLVETRAGDGAGLFERIRAIDDIIRAKKPLAKLGFVTEGAECEKLWDIRRALFPALAGTRLPEEYAYVEDYCVPPERLPEASRGLVRILQELGCARTGVNGHAMHGNLHCTLPLRLNEAGDVAKLGEFVERAAELILGLGGALKAEHGTGRAVASFVRREWGDELYGVMLELKALLDPAGILNRGCLLNDSPRCHVEHLKSAGVVGGGVDLCVDCGFCEAVCPSAKTGLSPRQRIYALRAMAGMEEKGERERLASWRDFFRTMGLDLCATDGLCSARCPLGLDVAGFMRALRHEELSDREKKAAAFVRRHMAPVTRAVSLGLSAAHALHGALGHERAEKSGNLAKKLTGMTVPDLREVRLTGGSAVPAPHVSGREKVVYFPSCAVRSMGYSGDSGRRIDPLMDVALRLLDKAGYDAVIPAHVEQLCCGKAFETKGMKEEAEASAKALDAALREASEGGRWPVMCDTSPCLARMKKTLDGSLSLYEPVEFTLRFLVDRLEFRKRRGCVAVHATCSTRAMGLVEELCRVARLCAEEVVLPEGIFCCGFSGDKGFTRPELNAAALEGLKDQIASCEEGFSTSRTCEVGLTKHGKKPYRNILYLIDECSSARK